MKSRFTARWYTGLVLVLGLFSAMGMFYKWNNLEIPFLEFPTSFKTVTVFSLSLQAIVTLLSGLWLILLFFGKDRFLQLHDFITNYLEFRRVRFILISIFFLMSFVAGQFLLQINDIETIGLRVLFDAHQVFFFWIILISSLSLAFFIAGKGIRQIFTHPEVFIPSILALSILIILIILNESRLGFRHASGGDIEGNFRLPGFPILDYQVIIPLIVVTGGFFLIRWIVLKWGKGRKFSAIAVDILIMLCLFIGSFLTSNSTPVLPNAFIDQPRPPNYTLSPNLDAELYELTSQTLLATGKMQTYVGEGDFLSVGRRSLLALYFAAMHLTAGLAYEDILPLQLLFFSLIPVLIYLFTKTLHNRVSGVLTAVLVIFRHQNGLLLADNVWGGANLHMLMSDFPTMIIVILFLILSIIWIRNFSENSFFPIILGGIVGLGMLIRQEVLVLLPMVSIAALLGRKPSFKIIFKQFFLLFIGTVVVLTPWITRNWAHTGKIYLDKPGNRVEKIIRTFKHGSEDLKDKDQDIDISFEEEGILPVDPSPLESDDKQLSRFQLLGNHYANAIPQLFLTLPSNPLGLNVDYLQKMVEGDLDKYYGGVFYSPYKYAKSLPYYWWSTWDGKIDKYSWIYLGFSVSLISLGIYQVWKKERWIIFVPLLAIFGMISIHALNQTSGGRWLQSIDWIPIMFLSIGLIEVSFRAQECWRGSNKLTHLLPETDTLNGIYPTLPSKWIITIIFLGVVLLGASPVIAEILIPNHYSKSEMESRVSSLFDESNPALSQDDLDLLLNFIDQDGQVIYGRALYPRYFPPDASLMTTNQRLFPSSTTFTISGSELNFVVFPRLEPPTSFPHGSDVLVFGCGEVSFPEGHGFPCLFCRSNAFDALAVLQLDEENQAENVLWRDGKNIEISGCPLTWPER